MDTAFESEQDKRVKQFIDANSSNRDKMLTYYMQQMKKNDLMDKMSKKKYFNQISENKKKIEVYNGILLKHEEVIKDVIRQEPFEIRLSSIHRELSSKIDGNFTILKKCIHESIDGARINNSSSNKSFATQFEQINSSLGTFRQKASIQEAEINTFREKLDRVDKSKPCGKFFLRGIDHNRKIACKGCKCCNNHLFERIQYLEQHLGQGTESYTEDDMVEDLEEHGSSRNDKNSDSSNEDSKEVSFKEINSCMGIPKPGQEKKAPSGDQSRVTYYSKKEVGLIKVDTSNFNVFKKHETQSPLVKLRDSSNKSLLVDRVGSFRYANTP
ncbi:unnamed protein product [Moneuplotes crassus]|uniref:Uncharacterized protein n=1 Tax=Euplotes crassus TaxID=5936 RepID=A0AAD2DAC1_EUPCR|nr:unnamed protein product [Moneuplotes crassus]